jgi:hypothetical protein
MDEIDALKYFVEHAELPRGRMETNKEARRLLVALIEQLEAVEQNPKRIIQIARQQMEEHGHVLLATLTVEGLRLTLANKHCFPEIPDDILERALHEADQHMDLGPVFEAHDEFEAVVVRYLAENHPELRKPWTGKPT